jgi:nitroimidazol reductase NimA-like FMN-containing flavoprotein (pyridoxamine 5'-phosphate oxidase superfamily)
MVEKKTLKRRLRELLDSQKLAVLSTHNQGQPYASLVAFAASHDLRYIYFATTRATRKYRNITNDPRVAFLVDSRTNREADFHQAIAVTVSGRAFEAEAVAGRAARKLYLAKHPYLEEFVGSPTCALFTVAVDCYYMVERFQKVTELHIDT